MKKTEQKQHLIDMMKDDEDLGLYDEIQPEQIWNKEKMEGIKQLIQEKMNEGQEKDVPLYTWETIPETLKQFWFNQFKKK